MPATKMTVNLPDFVRQKLKLAPFGNRSSATEISKKIDRYFLLIDEEKKYIKQFFSLAELNLFYELCKNERFIPAVKCKDGILLKVVNASEEVFTASGLERTALQERLQGLTTIQSIALVEILEDYSEN